MQTVTKLDFNAADAAKVADRLQAFAKHAGQTAPTNTPDHRERLLELMLSGSFIVSDEPCRNLINRILLMEYAPHYLVRTSAPLDIYTETDAQVVIKLMPIPARDQPGLMEAVLKALNSLHYLPLLDKYGTSAIAALVAFTGSYDYYNQHELLARILSNPNTFTQPVDPRQSSYSSKWI